MFDDVQAIGLQLVVEKKHRIDENVHGRIVTFIVYVDDQALDLLSLEVIHHIGALAAIIGNVERVTQRKTGVHWSLFRVELEVADDLGLERTLSKDFHFK